MSVRLEIHEKTGVPIEDIVCWDCERATRFHEGETVALGALRFQHDCVFCPVVLEDCEMGIEPEPWCGNVCDEWTQRTVAMMDAWR